MKITNLLLISLCILSIFISCTKDNIEDVITPNNPTNDSIISSPEDKEIMKYCILDGYEQQNSIAYLFENGSLLTINQDSIFGYTFHIGQMLESGEWDINNEIIIFTDSLYYPRIIRTEEYYYSYDYENDNKVKISAYDYNNNLIESQVCSLDQVTTTKTRGPVATTADITLGMVGLIQFIAKPTITGYVASLCTIIGWGEAIHQNNLEGASWGLAGALTSLILNAASKLNWVTAAVSAKVWLDELNVTWSKIWWGENPVFIIDSINASSTTAVIYYRLDYDGECKQPTVDVSYRHNDSATQFKSTSASKGNNSVKVTNLEPEKYYLARMSAQGDGILGMFGQLHTSMYFNTQKPMAITGDPQNIQRESVDIICRFKYLPEGAKCGIRYDSKSGHNTVSCKSIEEEQVVKISDLVPLTQYKYSTYIEYQGKYWDGEEKTFSTLPPNIDGVWQCEESDGTSYTVTIQNGECSWSNQMDSPGSVSWLGDGKLEFSILQDWYYEGWGRYSSVNFSGSINDLYNPTVISGNVEYHFGQMYLGTDYLTKSASFTMTK